MYSSDICRELKMYGSEYKNTKRLLKLCRNKKISTQALIGVDQYKLELMIDTLAQEEKAYYLASYKKIFEAVPKDKNYYDLLKTVRVYFEKDMDIIETAERMMLHRNTIRYRLNKFKEVYDIDVSKPYECMKLYIAIKLYMG
jgi:carbohydrate diacid regulator